MADFGRNFIDLFGNQAAKDLTAEVNRRLKKCDPDTAVGEVLYGLDTENADVGYDKTGSSWVRPTNDFGDSDQLCFESSTDIPEKLENHLVWFYSKVDPDVVLRNKYDTEECDFIGVRYKVVRNGKIFTFERRLAIYGTPVSEIDEDSDDEQITWEEVWDLQHEIGKEAMNDLSAEYPFAKKYAHIR
jgi:hypothetical protein